MNTQPREERVSKLFGMKTLSKARRSGDDEGMPKEATTQHHFLIRNAQSAFSDEQEVLIMPPKKQHMKELIPCKQPSFDKAVDGL